MGLSRMHRRVATWMAALAMLLVAFAPVLSHARAAAQGTHWLEVCGAEGARWVQADTGAPADDGTADSHLPEHCPYCRVSSSPLGVPPAPVSVPAGLGLGHAAPRAVFSAPRTLFAWLSGQPRAPPSFS